VLKITHAARPTVVEEVAYRFTGARGGMKGGNWENFRSSKRLQVCAADSRKTAICFVDYAQALGGSEMKKKNIPQIKKKDQENKYGGNR